VRVEKSCEPLVIVIRRAVEFVNGLTIDRGREGRLELEQLDAGVMSLNDYHARKGRDWESVEMQKAREILRRREIESEMGLEEGALDGFKQKQLDIQEDQNEQQDMVSDQSQE